MIAAQVMTSRAPVVSPRSQEAAWIQKPRCTPRGCAWTANTHRGILEHQHSYRGHPFRIHKLLIAERERCV
jgi:hypothetical protein